MKLQLRLLSRLRLRLRLQQRYSYVCCIRMLTLQVITGEQSAVILNLDGNTHSLTLASSIILQYMPALDRQQTLQCEKNLTV